MDGKINICEGRPYIISYISFQDHPIKISCLVLQSMYIKRWLLAEESVTIGTTWREVINNLTHKANMNPYGGSFFSRDVTAVRTNMIVTGVDTLRLGSGIGKFNFPMRVYVWLGGAEFYQNRKCWSSCTAPS